MVRFDLFPADNKSSCALCNEYKGCCICNFVFVAYWKFDVAIFTDVTNNSPFVESAKDVKMLIEYSPILNKDFISRFCPVHR